MLVKCTHICFLLNTDANSNHFSCCGTRNRCTFRFPSTNIKLVFQSLVDDKQQGEKVSERQQNREAFKSAIAPLKVNIPDSSDFVSPAPSPTGTIR